MDKRNFIFIFLFTITIFFVHHYFIADKPAPQVDNVAVVEEKPSMSDQDIQSRTAKLSSLPTAEFYLDAAGEQFLSSGLRFQDCYMLYKTSQDLPESIYVKASNGSLKPITSLAEATKVAPAVYGNSSSSQFSSIHLPQVGEYDVQLVYLPEDSSKLAVTLAKYENGRIDFPRASLDTKAIVLAKDQGQYYPIGFYSPTSSQMVPINSSAELAKVVSFKTSSSIKPSALIKNEEFYVLENDYIQVVFSNRGGSISEINLPFKTKTNKNSVVLPIEFDRTIEKKYSRNAYFPVQSYHAAGTSQMQEPTLGGYYPLLRRDIEGTSGRTTFQTPPRFYALNIVSEDDPDLAQKPYSVKRFNNNLIEFELVSSERRITKTFMLSSLEGESIPYSLDLQIKLEGDTRNLNLTTGVPEVELISGSASPDLKYRYLRNGKPVVDKMKLPKDDVSVRGIVPSWICNSNGFFGVIINPTKDALTGFEASKVPGNVDPTRLSIIDAAYNLYPADKYPGYIMQLPLKGSSKVTSFRVFAGPFDHSTLNKVDTLFKDPTTGITPGFSAAQSFHGWFVLISEPFAKFLFLIMKAFYSFTHSWGLCIILITIVLRVILYPLNAWSLKSMARMQHIAPEVAAIKKRYSKDPKRANLEVMQLYRERKVNPFSGCLPQLIQIPFLIGMFDLLKSAFPLRGTSFIPGWIDNLTAPDVIVSWSYPIFFFGTQLHLLPFILGGLTFLQQKMSQAQNKHKVVDPEALKQSKLTSNMITIVFTVLFYNFPSGLNIYWISSTVLGMWQMYYIQKSANARENIPKKV